MKLDVSKPLLDLNDRCARQVRALLDGHGVFVLDLMASPGAGKTSTILATIAHLRERFRIAVIEGDIASDVDSVRIKEQGIPAVQINTGGACHLESQMIRRALDVLDLDALDLVIIENVGNLVCPTDFYLGEDAKVMILSVPEGHDKPLKYPGIFQVSSAVILNKIDTLPVFDFDEQAFREGVEQLNPGVPVFALSATGGQGVEEWAEWLAERVAKGVAERASKEAAGASVPTSVQREGVSDR
ncbi:MAG: hydrogenase nickel incorporation protein HypB [Coriobacteriales bacterium]|jgi:hydrogenase nickel incorporation protein HypB|nr:hydrogenase nickel incorporation protein HypB [Coriobacteriales bacterium]